MRSEEHAELKGHGKFEAHVVGDSVRQVRKDDLPEKPEPKDGAEVPVKPPLLPRELVHRCADRVKEPERCEDPATSEASSGKGCVSGYV